MKYKNNKSKRGFTLIELIAVLVILAIIALIATPLVMNIVKKAKDSANKRSVDAYGKAVELAVATHLLDTGDYPTTLDNLTVEYTGNEVVCDIKKLNEDGSIYLSECSVKGIEVKASSTEDGFYHYGKTKEPYKTYAVGDVVTYNNIDFYAIEDSDASKDYVTLLKAEPLRTDEMSSLIESTEVSNFISSSGEYLTVPYLSRDNCVSGGNTTGCTTDYSLSVVKQIVDVWGAATLEDKDLTEDYLGYKIRLITYNELLDNLGYEFWGANTITSSPNPEITPEWVYSSNYNYFTMSQYGDYNDKVVVVYDSYANMYNVDNVEGSSCARPVINLKKSAI